MLDPSHRSVGSFQEIARESPNSHPGTVEPNSAAASPQDGGHGSEQIQSNFEDRVDGALRAQLIRFDTALSVPLRASNGTAEGAGLFLLDKRDGTLQFWVHYTAPLDYIERGATLRGANGNAVHPLPLGTVYLRRIGFYDRYEVGPRSRCGR